MPKVVASTPEWGEAATCPGAQHPALQDLGLPVLRGRPAVGSRPAAGAEHTQLCGPAPPTELGHLQGWGAQGPFCLRASPPRRHQPWDWGCSPPREKGRAAPSEGGQLVSTHTCCPDKQPLGGWVPRSEGRRAQAAPPARAGLQAARAPLELGAPGRSESGWGPGGLCSALGVPPAPSGVRGEWHDGTHHWWMNQVCGDLPESPGALSHGLRPQQPGPGRPPEWARLGRASWAGSAGLAPRPAVSCPRRQRGCPRPCRSWSWPPRSC